MLELTSRDTKRLRCKVRLYPEWEASSEFILKHVNSALKMDAKLSSHPIEVECKDPNMITQVRENYDENEVAI